MTTRRLTAILAADMVGYSHLMATRGALSRLQVMRSEVISNLRVQQCAPHSEMVTDSYGLRRGSDFPCA
jgi:hypothetical protein